jgi:predicted O-methyltransferase YrrM
VKAVRPILSVAAAAGRLATQRRGREALRSLGRELLFENERRLPSRYLADLIPGAGAIAAHCALDPAHDWELPYAERAILDGITRMLGPSAIFEFGTFTGKTTLLLANAAPLAQVHTIDLPPSGDGEDVVGSAFIGELAADRIIQHRADSRVFDYSALEGAVDLVFIDASHEFDDVVSDSEHALRLLKPDGLVVWDDYHPRHPGVYRALNQLSDHLVLTQIARTRLVIYHHAATPPQRDPSNW